jgi:hypothetical protein
MPLEYFLIDNPITPDPNDRRAVPKITRFYTMEDVYDQMVSRGSTVTRGEGLSTIEEFILAITTLLKDGGAINTPLIRIAPTITGVFTSDDDAFDRSRHAVNLRITAGERLRGLSDDIPVEKVPASRNMPTLNHFEDTFSKTQDDIMTPGKTGKITGSNLKFTETEMDQGIFFIKTTDGSVTRVTENLARNKPGELIFAIPDTLTAGSYRVEVRALLTGVKSVRSGSLPYELVVS